MRMKRMKRKRRTKRRRRKRKKEEERGRGRGGRVMRRPQLLVLRDTVVGVLLGGDGRPLSTAGVAWTDLPAAAVAAGTYVLALLQKFIEVHTPLGNTHTASSHSSAHTFVAFVHTHRTTFF